MRLAKKMNKRPTNVWILSLQTFLNRRRHHEKISKRHILVRNAQYLFDSIIPPRCVMRNSTTLPMKSLQRPPVLRRNFIEQKNLARFLKSSFKVAVIFIVQRACDDFSHIVVINERTLITNV